MQKGDLYTEFNAQSAKYRDIGALLREHEHLFRWSCDEVVLDAGCGPGDVTHNVLLPWLPEKACKYVVGVDVSPAMKEHGYQNFPHPKLIFDTLDLTDENMAPITNDPRLKDGFDKIFSFYVLNWIYDLKTALKNIYTLLKPRGQALFMFPANRHYQKTYAEIQKRQPWSDLLQGVSRDISPYFYSDDPAGEFTTLLKEVGFKVNVCKCVHTEDEFENLDVLKKLIESLDKYNSRIPAELKAHYLDECADFMRANNALKDTKDGKVAVPHRRLIALIEK